MQLGSADMELKDMMDFENLFTHVELPQDSGKRCTTIFDRRARMLTEFLGVKGSSNSMSGLIDCESTLPVHDDFCKTLSLTQKQLDLSATALLKASMPSDSDPIDLPSSSHSRPNRPATQNRSTRRQLHLQNTVIDSRTMVPSSAVRRREKQPPLLRQAKQDAPCQCIDSILQANELMQLQFAPPLDLQDEFTINIDDTLQIQKEILDSLTALLQCRRCSARSEYMTLTVSSCQEVLRSIQELHCLTLSSDSHHEFSIASQTLRTGEYNERGTGRSGSKKLMASGRWRLDDEAEAEIFWNLIEIRVTKLEKLLRQLEEVARVKRLKCLRIVQAMRETVLDSIVGSGYGRSNSR